MFYTETDDECMRGGRNLHRDRSTKGTSDTGSPPSYDLMDRMLLIDAAKPLVNCFVVSPVDNCNALPTGSPLATLNKLQRIVENSTTLRRYCAMNCTGCT